MTTVDQLKQNILSVIQTDNYSINELKNVLAPIPIYTDNQIFTDNITTIISIIVTKRDGNSTFDIEDLKLLGTDMSAMTSLITSLILIMGAIPNTKLTYNSGDTEILVLKMLAFVFLVVVPKQANLNWTLDEKTTIVNISVSIYEFLQSSQVVKDIIAKVVAWFKTKNFCVCLAPHANNTTVVQQNMPQVTAQLAQSVTNAKDKSAMMKEIKALKRKVDDMVKPQ